MPTPTNRADTVSSRANGIRFAYQPHSCKPGALPRVFMQAFSMVNGSLGPAVRRRLWLDIGPSSCSTMQGLLVDGRDGRTDYAMADTTALFHRRARTCASRSSGRLSFLHPRIHSAAPSRSLPSRADPPSHTRGTGPLSGEPPQGSEIRAIPAFTTSTDSENRQSPDRAVFFICVFPPVRN